MIIVLVEVKEETKVKISFEKESSFHIEKAESLEQEKVRVSRALLDK
jgi:hypothetical protein